MFFYDLDRHLHYVLKEVLEEYESKNSITLPPNLLHNLINGLKKEFTPINSSQLFDPSYMDKQELEDESYHVLAKRLFHKMDDHIFHYTVKDPINKNMLCNFHIFVLKNGREWEKTAPLKILR